MQPNTTVSPLEERRLWYAFLEGYGFAFPTTKSAEISVEFVRISTLR